MGNLSTIGLYIETALYLWSSWYVQEEGDPELGMRCIEIGGNLKIESSVPIPTFSKPNFEAAQTICNNAMVATFTPAYTTEKNAFNTEWSTALPVLYATFGDYVRSFLKTDKQRLLTYYEDNYDAIKEGVQIGGFFYIGAWNAPVRTSIDALVASISPIPALATTIIYPIL